MSTPLYHCLNELDHDGIYEIDDGAQNWTPDSLIEALCESAEGRAELERQVNCLCDPAPPNAELPASVGSISFIGADGYQVPITRDGYTIWQMRR